MLAVPKVGVAKAVCTLVLLWESFYTQSRRRKFELDFTTILGLFATFLYRRLYDKPERVIN